MPVPSEPTTQRNSVTKKLISPRQLVSQNIRLVGSIRDDHVGEAPKSCFDQPNVCQDHASNFIVGLISEQVIKGFPGSRQLPELSETVGVSASNLEKDTTLPGIALTLQADDCIHQKGQDGLRFSASIRSQQRRSVTE